MKVNTKKAAEIAGAVLIVVVITAMLWFIITKKNNTDTGKKSFCFDGTWLIYQYGETHILDEFMVFDGKQIADYRGNNSDAYFTAEFTYENGELQIESISKSFSVKILSEYRVSLVEPDTREWKMLRVSKGKFDEIEQVTAPAMVGSYRVISVANTARSGENIIFSRTELEDLRDGESYMRCTYQISEHYMKIENLEEDYLVYKIEDMIFLIGMDTGYVWELQMIES